MAERYHALVTIDTRLPHAELDAHTAPSGPFAPCFSV
jgi:hypothetical protein